MTMRLAVKRLAAGEVDPNRSNQHEFNAGRLRQELGFPAAPKTLGVIEFLFAIDDHSAPIDASETFTLYDARASKLRASEWRMYYKSNVVYEHAREGDLMVMCRPDPAKPTILALIARRGTALERCIARDLAGSESAEIRLRIFSDVTALTPTTLRALVESVLRPEEIPHAVGAPKLSDRDLTAHPLYVRTRHHLRTREKGWFPTGREMAAAGKKFLAEDGITTDDPDVYLHLLLAAETILWNALRDLAMTVKVAEIAASGGTEVERAWRHHEIGKLISQSQKPRRGNSLEYHFRVLLDERGIRYSHQCKTEERTTDFIFPSCEVYQDMSFPERKLRMVGCKTTVRERHGQWVEEAKRVSVKYGLSLDKKLSANLVTSYRSKLLFFLPRPVLDEAYADKPHRNLIGTVTDLIRELESANAVLRVRG